ncbi:hypothetical protein HRW07_08685 [Streptomyces lunaelactis]|uniref:hypothetical protein n=1 Tax=Streptomyces lunaelactis TaxID=1535768 RepID=UPI0015850951|nr:hypothetical protein [Streptomyces lunaelactis]NUL03315.1 hypothetical protein [Streptomyces lunaelactis]
MTMNGEPTGAMPVASFASDQRRAGYVRAMRQLEAGREPGKTVRTYVSVPGGIRDRKGWPWRLKEIRKSLPQDIRLSRFPTIFGEYSDGQRDYDRDWSEYFAGLDGLILVGYRSRSGPLRVRLGPLARRELLAVVPTGRPVFVHAWEKGLVPLVDCEPVKVDIEKEGRERLNLTIPPAWSPQTDTLQAALAALTPMPALDETGQVPASRQPLRMSAISAGLDFGRTHVRRQVQDI